MATRWFVEVSPVGEDAGKERYCVEAAQWQQALQETRALRNEKGALSRFSIELLADGYRAVDNSMKLRYTVTRAPADAPLTGPSAAPKAAPPAPTRSGGASVPSSPTVELAPPGIELTLLTERSEEPSTKMPMAYRERAYQVAPGTSPEDLERALRKELESVSASLAGYSERKFVQLAAFDYPLSGRPTKPPVGVLAWKDWRGDAVIQLTPPAAAPASQPPPAAPRSQPPPAAAPASQPPPAAPRSQPPSAAVSVAPTHAVTGGPGTGSFPSPTESRSATNRPALELVGEETGPVPPAEPRPQAGTPAPRVLPAEAKTDPSGGARRPPVDAGAPTPAAPAQPPPAGPPSAVEASPQTQASAQPDTGAPVAPTAVEPEPAPPAPPIEPAAPAAAAPTSRDEDEAAPPTTASPAEGAPAAPTAPEPPKEAEPAPPPSRSADRDLIVELFERMHELHFMPDIAGGAEYVLAALSESIPCEGMIIHIFDIDTRDFVVVRAIGPNANSLLLHRTPDKDPLMRDAQRRTRAIKIDDPMGSADHDSPRWLKLGLSATRALCGPVQQGGRYLGAIELANPAGGEPFFETELHALDYICEQFADFVADRPIVLDEDAIRPKD